MGSLYESPSTWAHICSELQFHLDLGAEQSTWCHGMEFLCALICEMLDIHHKDTIIMVHCHLHHMYHKPKPGIFNHWSHEKLGSVITIICEATSDHPSTSFDVCHNNLVLRLALPCTPRETL